MNQVVAQWLGLAEIDLEAARVLLKEGGLETMFPLAWTHTYLFLDKINYNVIIM
jgi:hypothetical protein